MNDVILKNLKEKIKSKDTLYYLGDLTFKKNVAQEFFKSLRHVEIHYIIGNHDSKSIIRLANQYCRSVSDLCCIKINEQSIFLSHYCMTLCNDDNSLYSWFLHGHSHGRLKLNGRNYDVGVDNNNFFPVSFDELAKIMKLK